MSANTSIQWTDRTWNPTRGCSRVSPGCDSCYAMGQAHRFSGPGKPYEGLTTIRRGKVDWTGVARFIPSALAEPLGWRKPQRIFVNSMSDLFHESLSNEEIAAVFGVMAACPQHTFQVLTKRPLRARAWFEVGQELTRAAGERLASERGWCHANEGERWPLPNVWLGVSAENQATADARIPEILRCPAALHFVSAEPLLGPLDLTRYLQWGSVCECPGNERKSERCEGRGPAGWIRCNAGLRAIRWVIVGGESGNGARPCDVSWVDSIVKSCAAKTGPRKARGSTACFVKQLGALPFVLDGANGGPTEKWPGVLHVKDRKGGDMSEWPEPLRIREFPKEAARG